MKVLHTIGGFGAKSGGTSTCTYDLLYAMQNGSDIIDIVTPSVIDTSDKIMGNAEEWIKSVTNDYKTPISYSSNLKHWINESCYDIYHTNGLWMYVNHISCKAARKKDKPYLITPHGMLYPVALNRSYWKKWPLIELWFKKDINNASCIHATCKQEAEYIRKFGYKGPIAIIPNPVAIPSYIDEILINQTKQPTAKKKIGFLGRLHPRKNVESIIRGLALSDKKDIELSIMGKGDEEYESFLKNEANRLGIQDQVKFLGFVNGKEKYEQLASLNALFVPSDFENFGMIIPEALIVGTPVMASLGTPWESLNTKKCGWWCNNSPETIAKVIDELYNLSDKEYKAMARRGREYVLNTYSADKVAKQMLHLYKWLLGQAEKPDFVYSH